jgi:sulfite exporter TauE/SafE
MLVLLAFYVLQKSQLLDVNLGSVVDWKTAFFVGLIASVSSCLALVGGLVLSLSAKASEDGLKRSRLIFFHASRLISFAIFGAALGYLGESIQINYTLGSVLGLASGLVMLVLGLNLSGISSWMPAIPAGISRFFMKFERSRFAPLSLGAVSFFLPCGFTQSMQFAAILSGSVTQGSIIMLAFALGTLPVLSLVSFGGYEISNNKKFGVLLKAMGLVILGLGLFSLTISLWGLGLFI